MIVNRHDEHRVRRLIATGRAHDHADIEILAQCLRLRGGDGMVIDAGASIGTHALALAAVIGPRRKLQAFEPQRQIFNMLAGSAALNAATNIVCHNVALGDRDGRIEAPQFDYDQPLNFGAVEFGGVQRERLSQLPCADPERVEFVPLARLDSFGFEPVALLKIDVEGMEMLVLDGAAETIARDRPILFVEHHKVDREALARRIAAWGYAVYPQDINFLCIPSELTDVIRVQVGAG
jgi:FkbM family methyltransferase